MQLRISGKQKLTNMKNTFNKNKKNCTIISDTPYCLDRNGELVGLGPTVEEIDHLATLFTNIYHFAPLYKIDQPKSYIRHQKSNISIIPMTPSGGRFFFNKLKHFLLFPINILKLRPFLKKTDIIHFRAPTGFGVLFLPWIYVFWSKKIWIKYGGSWTSNDVPRSYKFQRWILKYFPKNAIITINNSTDNLKENFYQFLNPCFRSEIIKNNKTIVHKKNFRNGLNLIFVGRVEKNKGIDDIFKIFQKIGGMKNINSLKIVGESKREKYFKEIAISTSSKISILGSLNRKDIFKLYEDSHVLILLSKSEGFPKVIMEAGVFGCVPVVSNFSGISDIIKHGFEGFIMNSYNSKYSHRDFQLVFEDIEALKFCSMNIFKKSQSFTYENYLRNIENAVLH